MKLLLTLAAVFFISLGCSGQKDGITIEGKVENPAGKKIVLQKYTSDNVKDVATTEIKSDNMYSMNVEKLEPGFYRINFFDKQFINLILNEDDVIVNAHGSDQNGNYEIKGSSEMDQIAKVKNIMEKFQEELNQLNTEFGPGLAEQNQEVMEKAQAKFVELQKKYSGKIKSEIKSMGNSIAVLQAIAYLDPDQDINFMDSVASAVAKKNPNLSEAQQVKSDLEEMKKFAIGSSAPDFTLPDTNGNMVSLSSFKGNYVLLDFWAAWCRPCRMENPNIVEAYKKYNPEGFEVFGVSLDQNDASWQQAIKQDGLLWKQVRDTKNEVATQYQVSSIPMSFLLDKEGKIIAKNLRGPALEAKLKEIFNK